ncbi:lyase family protein [Lysinibacillus sphaericus]|uniref:lyase family protein n=1 Tax=Lysinibacillus TaxID=400634 RepID=UPI003AF40980
MNELEDTLEWKVNEFQTIIKISRTCLQDALSMTFGQQFKANLMFNKKQKRELLNLQQDCLTIVIGASYCCWRRHLKLILQFKK